MHRLRSLVARLAAVFALATVAGSLLIAGASHVQAQTAGATVTYQPGWNLVAIPSGGTLSGQSGPLYTFQPGDTDYETPMTFQTGFGYWAYFTSPTQVTLGAGSGSAYSVNAPASQYIMVGDPSGTQPATVSGADAVYTFDPVANTYVAATTLNPGQGAWVISLNGGTITVTPSGSPVATGTPANVPPAGVRPPAARFYGGVTVNGQPAASGTPITATASNGAVCGSTTVGAAPASGSNYALDIVGSDPACSTPGATMTFTVGGAPATAPATATIPDVSGPVRADLSVP